MNEAHKNAIKHIADIIHGNNCTKGFYKDYEDLLSFALYGPHERQVQRLILSEILIKIMGECAEAHERLRKDPAAMDEHCPQHKNFYVEVADSLIRVFDFMGYLQMNDEGCPDFGKIVQDKLAYNQTRPYKHGKTC